VFNVVKLVRLEINEIVRYLPDKHKNKNSAPSQSVASAQIAPKICQGQPPTFGSQCSQFHPNRFTFGGVIAEHVRAVLLAHKVFAIFARNLGE